MTLTLGLFIVFAVIFALLTVGASVFAVKCLMTRGAPAKFLAVPGVLLALVFLSFTIYFIRRLPFLD